LHIRQESSKPLLKAAKSYFPSMYQCTIHKASPTSWLNMQWWVQ